MPLMPDAEWIEPASPAKLVLLQLAVVLEWGGDRLGWYAACHPQDVSFDAPGQYPRAERLVEALIQMAIVLGQDPGCLDEPWLPAMMVGREREPGPGSTVTTTLPEAGPVEQQHDDDTWSAT